MNELITINNVRGYLDENGTAQLNLEDIAKGLGFTQNKNDVGYVRWERVNKHLVDMGFPQLVGKEFIPENVFYRLAMKGENESALAFQIKIADEVLPAIRKHGGYLTPAKIEEVLLNPDTIIRLATSLKEEQAKNKQLEAITSKLTVENIIMKPKAEYFDELVDRNLLTSFRDTAKELKVKEKTFVDFLLVHKYIFRDKKGKLQPYADKNNGLFEVKETFNEKTNWRGTQTFITPKGRETLRVLTEGLKGA